MTAPFDDFEDQLPVLMLRWDGDLSRWRLYDTDAGVTLSFHRTLLLAEAAQIAESWRRQADFGGVA